MELLMWVLVAEILASPLADTYHAAGVALGICVLGSVFYAASTIAIRPLVRRVTIIIACLWMVARLLEALASGRLFYSHLSSIIGLAFSLSILWAIFGHFHYDSGDLRSAISEAFIGYLVIATAFSQLYWILNRILEHPFNQVVSASGHATVLYFSMVTLTSIGYGDIIPLNPYIRMIAAMESMAGLFYIAVIVARLVASYRPGSAEPAVRPD